MALRPGLEVVESGRAYSIQQGVAEAYLAQDPVVFIVRIQVPAIRTEGMEAAVVVLSMRETLRLT